MTIRIVVNESVRDQVEMRELDFVVSQLDMNLLRVVVIV